MKNQLKIRDAVAGEAEIISALVNEAYGKYVARLGRPPLPMCDDYQALIAEGVVSVLADGTAILGVLVLRNGLDHMLLENVAVAPAHQGHGLGALLLDYGEAQARARGHGEIRLYTNAAMTENIALYKNRGYRETSRETGKTRRVFMAKPV